MKPRRLPIWVVAVALAFHLLGMVRSNLPAQDGLKFLRFASEFHRQPWLAVLKDCDQHPLYPATIAVCEPVTEAEIMLRPGALIWLSTIPVLEVELLPAMVRLKRVNDFVSKVPSIETPAPAATELIAQGPIT